MFNREIREGLTFDDVLLIPAHSPFSPAKPISPPGSPQISASISLCCLPPWIPSPRRAPPSAWPVKGGIGIIHKNLTIEEQAMEVDKVKKSESGMIVDPITMRPTQKIREALEMMAKYRISGVPITKSQRQAGRHPDQPRPALRNRSRSADFRADDQAESGDRSGRDHPGRGQGASEAYPGGKAAGGRQRAIPEGADHHQGYREGQKVSQCLQGQPGPPAGRRRGRPDRRHGGARRCADAGPASM